MVLWLELRFVKDCAEVLVFCGGDFVWCRDNGDGR